MKTNRTHRPARAPITIVIMLAISSSFSMHLRCFADELSRIPVKGYKPQAVTTESKEGEDWFDGLNCMACHSIHSVGGTLGPALDGIGAVRSREYLIARLADTEEEKRKFASLADPKRLGDVHVRLSVPTTMRITAYLLTLPEPPNGFIVTPHVRRRPAEPESTRTNYKPAALTASSEAGRKLYWQTGCAACHSVGKVGGWFAPALDGIGGRHSREFITDHISNPKTHSAIPSLNGETEQSRMPRMPLPAEEVRQLTEFLMTLPNP